MRSSTWVIVLFLLAIALIDAGALAVRPDMGVSDLSDFHYSGEGDELVDSPATPSRYVGAFVWGLFLSQVSLAAIWLALGLSALPLRFIIVSTILLVLNVGIFHLTQQGPDLSFGLIFTGEMALAVAVPLFAARYFGLRFVDWRTDDYMKSSHRGRNAGNTPSATCLA